MSPDTATQLKVVTLLGAVTVAAGLVAALALDLGLTGLWLALLIGTPISIGLEQLVALRAHATKAPQPAGEARAGA